MDMIPFGQLQLMSPPSSDGAKTVMDKGDIALAGKGFAAGASSIATRWRLLLQCVPWLHPLNDGRRFTILGYFFPELNHRYRHARV